VIPMFLVAFLVRSAQRGRSERVRVAFDCARGHVRRTVDGLGKIRISEARAWPCSSTARS